MLDIEASPYPFGIFLHWDDQRPSHHRPPPDGISGWTRVSLARMELPFGRYERQLVTCVDEDGQAVSDFLKTRLMSLRRTSPKPIDLFPPDEDLSEIEDGLTWDFMGMVDKEILALLDRAVAERDQPLRRLEQRVAIFLQEADDWAKEKHRIRRDPRTPPGMRRGIEGWLSDLAWELDRLGREQRAESERIRASTDGLEAQVLESLGSTPDVQHHCTFHWQVRHRRMTSDRFAAGESVRIKLNRRPRG